MNADMRRAWLRSLTIQASWTDERLQGIGAAYTIDPLLRPLANDSAERYRTALARSAGYFNTHPFLGGLALGAVARAEHEGTDATRVERLRSALRGPLGSIGDRLVWAGVLPLASAAGIALSALGHPVAGAVTLLVIFNVAHVTLWLWGLPTGWRLGIRVIQALQNVTLQRGLLIVGPLASCAAGFAVPVAGVYVLTRLGPDARVGAMALAGGVVIVLRVLFPAFGAARLGALVAAAALIMGWLWP